MAIMVLYAVARYLPESHNARFKTVANRYLNPATNWLYSGLPPRPEKRIAEAVGTLLTRLSRPMRNQRDPADRSTPSRHQVWKMFDRIAHRYDLLNRLLSLGRDVAWRRQVSRYLPEREALSVLDLACGTADMLISLKQNSGRIKNGVGVDMAGEMLKIARKKIQDRNLDKVLSVVEGDALRLPIADGSFDAVTIAFGVRNLTDVSEGLRHMYRILNQGGRSLILEFSLPSNRVMRAIYLVYFRYVLPVVGSVVSGDSQAYRYLNRTVETFPHGDDFCQLMRQVGFEDIRAHPLTFGIATIYEGTRPGRESPVELPRETGGHADGYSKSVESIKERVEKLILGDPSPFADAPDRLVRIESPLSGVEPLEWLESVTDEVKLYWSDRSGELEAAGIGIADVLDDEDCDDLPQALEYIRPRLSAVSDDVRYYGGHRFDINRRADDDWRPFGVFRFILPRFEVVKTPAGTCLVCNLILPRDKEKLSTIVAGLDPLYPVRQPVSQPGVALGSRKDFPDLSGWRRAVESFLAESPSRALDKLVLARKTDLIYPDSLPAISILRRLREKTDHCYHFFFQPAAGVAFLGASPERLYRRISREVECDAIAGTRPRGRTDDEDRRLACDLQQSDKDLREHRLVVASVKESLSWLVESGPETTDEPERILKLANVQHLRTTIKGSLANGIGDAELISALHPTAAVGGYPRRDVLSSIEGAEPFDRGWYAGPVGWVAKDSSEFAVAIRSALAHQRRLSLFAGAGIVSGSEADSEWNELENKISSFVRVMSDED